MKVLVTGGAGYIGSHTVLELIEAGHSPVVLDTLDNGHAEALRRVGRLTQRTVPLVVGDVRDTALVRETLTGHGCEAVIHFAGLKAVGESVAQPLRYFEYNLVGAVRLLGAMQDAGVRRFIFSSSATVYGAPQALPLTEDHPLSATNPYGRSKLMIEEMLGDLHAAQPGWGIAILRYFNPVGAHGSGEIGEDPKGTPNNLMPFVAQVAAGRRERLRVWGADYPTRDGTGERDYIHVADLARGHIAALEKTADPGLLTVNLGTGRSYSVLEVVAAFTAASGHAVPYDILDRRPGDIAACYADTARARDLLGWEARHDLEAMCADHWRWQAQNPDGYDRP